ncbi:MAG: hypothetical protein HKN68_05685 [Saprospiraceae bacterium]|nr:hypothetical protein [Saprospiraceae bacterium]
MQVKSLLPQYSRFSIREDVIDWLLEGDVSIQYQVHKYLFNEERPDLQERILTEGWGKAFMDARNSDGGWGEKYYQPKWTSTHYTLLDICQLMPVKDARINSIIEKTITETKGPDGGILPIGNTQVSDMCINGMFLNFASYFEAGEEGLQSVVDCLIDQWMPDGGFNCRLNRSGARHSSMHTTISVLEGISSYLSKGYQYRKDYLIKCRDQSIEFLLIHNLFKSDHTGEIIHKDFLKLCHPSRWKYNVLRALDYFALVNVPWDDRMKEGIMSVLSKINKSGTFNVQAHHSGKVHFVMEKAGRPSRWNTLRVLRVLKEYSSKLQ